MLCLPRRLAAPISILLIASCPFDAPADPSFGAMDLDSTFAFGAAPRPLSPIAARSEDLEFENIRSDSGTISRIAYENRRFRHSMDAFGHVARGRYNVVAYEQRLGMTAARIQRTAGPEGPRFRVNYPSDRGFEGPPGGWKRRPTYRRADLVVGPLLAYDLGRIDRPVQVQFETQVALRYNPWPGGLAVGSILFPMYSDFEPDILHPDVENIRPGQLKFDQYLWIPGLALASGSAGVYPDNRYGTSFGVARPLFEGSVLLDAQIDVTGFVAFNDVGIEYSPAEQVSAYGAASWLPPWRDITLRARYARFLYGDEGAELSFLRDFGDFSVQFLLTKSNDLTVETVRLVFPIPPMTRTPIAPLNPMLVERFPISFRTDATPVGKSLVGAASREEYLRQLGRPSLVNNEYRYRRAQGPKPPEPEPEPINWANHSGMTGFIITPWAGVQPESHIEAGYTYMPKKWAYNQEGTERGVYHNEIYYASLGLLPRLEIGLRITRTPGYNPFGDIDLSSQLTTDTDHMASFKVGLLEPKPGRPGLAVGVEDIQGTRRYHSAYLVAGLPHEIFRVQSRFSLGYASRVFTASRYVLDGVFGAIEVSPWRAVAARFEYDTEKINVGLGFDLGFGLRIRAAALNMESLSAGVGWHHKL